MVIELKDGEMITHTIFKGYEGLKNGQNRKAECVVMSYQTYCEFKSELTFAYQPCPPDAMKTTMVFNGMKIIRSPDVDDNTLEMY